MQALLDNPLILIIAGVVLLGLLGAALVASRRRTQQTRTAEGRIDKALADGKYGEAAGIALASGRVDEAIDYYMRGQQPLTAAQVAARAGKARIAAEAFERGEDYEQAARWYAKAGMEDKALEVRRLAPVEPQARLPEARDADPLSLPPPAADTAVASALASLGEGPAPDTVDEGSPSARAERLEKTFRDALARAPDGDVRALAEDAAEALLAVGLIRRAADVYRDADLADEAIHLYVNLLGAPGEAAPLVARHGNHERAAELYELAGMKERAAASLCEVGGASDAPETWFARIDELSRDVGLRYLEDNAHKRPIARETAELHYLLGRTLDERGESDRALEVLRRIEAALGDYKDVNARVVRLRDAESQRDPRGEREPHRKGDDEHDAWRDDDRRTRPSAGHERGERRGADVDDRHGRGIRPSAGREGRYAHDERATRPSAGMERTTGRSDRPHADLLAEELADLAAEAVRAAMDRERRGDVMAVMSGTPTARRRVARATSIAVGLEVVPVQLELACDPAVLRAREGPNVESLWRFIGERECDLQNIEVYYRLGLAYVAAGQWKEALDAFAAVEEASPGYRDAERRADEIQAWQHAHGKSHLLAGRATEAAPATRTAASTAAATGDQGRYEIRGELGRGGMAVVYRAVDSLLGRDVALKFIAEELGLSQQARDLFQREARSAAQLNHPNVVTIYDFGVLEGRLFIAMEYLEGTTVERLIDQGLLPVVDSLRICVQVLDALDYAHERQLVHRDVKPSNMIRTPTGLVKLMDFGLAKSVAEGAKASLIAGTPAYMPPEQFVGGLIDHRADIFAVGASLYEMLTGTLPFEGTDRTRAPRPMRDMAPTLPAVLDEVVSRALALDPGERTESAADMAAPLRELVQAVDQAAANAPAASLTATEARTLKTRPSGAPEAHGRTGAAGHAPASASAATAPVVSGGGGGTWKSR